MAQSDKHQNRLLLSLFEALKPYSGNLSLPKDEFGEIHFNRLADDIIGLYPKPIGYELSKLFRPEFERYDENRLNQIIRTFEQILKFLAFVMIIDLHRLVKEKSVTVPDGFKVEFKRRFCTVTIGNLSWYIENIGKIFDAAKAGIFIPELHEKLNRGFYGNIHWIVPERNDKGHFKFEETPEFIEKQCPEYFEKLFGLLSEIPFITAYKLVSIQRILVEKGKLRPPNFIHNFSILNEKHASKPVGLESILDCQAVVLCREMQEIRNKYLNLSPLIIDTNIELKDILRSDDPETMSKITRDLYLYSRFDGNNRLEYTGISTSYQDLRKGIDLRVLNFYQHLLAEYEDLVNTICN